MVSAKTFGDKDPNTKNKPQPILTNLHRTRQPPQEQHEQRPHHHTLDDNYHVEPFGLVRHLVFLPYLFAQVVGEDATKMGALVCSHLRFKSCVDPASLFSCECQDCDLRRSASRGCNVSELVPPFCHADTCGTRSGAVQELLDQVERHEEELFVMSTLKATAEANLFACVGADGPDVGVHQELVVRVLEVHGNDLGALDGQDVYVAISHKGCRFSTKSKPCSGWSSGGGISTKGNVHFTWNDQFSFVAVQGSSAPLSLSFLRIDNSVIAEAEVGLPDLSDQRVCHQWFQLGQTWRLYAALQFVSSPEELLHAHIAEFESRLQQIHQQLRVLTEQVNSLVPEDIWQSCALEQQAEPKGEFKGKLLGAFAETVDEPMAEPAAEPPPSGLLNDALSPDLFQGRALI